MNSTALKSDFIMSLVEQIDKSAAGPKQKSIIDRCIKLTYGYADQLGVSPTLTLLRNCLMEQKEKEAKEIALSLELYTEGSLNIFARESNVDLSSRIIVFDIHGLANQMKSAGLLIITDSILNRVTMNFFRGRRTHVLIDEFHVVYENEYSASFFTSVWRQFRKRNAYPTAITQNVEYLLSSVSASTMLSNSDFLIMFSQSSQDSEKLGKLLNISTEQMSYVKNPLPGKGLIKYGGCILPFDSSIDTQFRIYSLMSTKPGEGIFSGKNERH